MNTSLIVKSLDRTRTLSQLRKEFDRHRSNNHTVISPVQAKVLDMVSWGLYLGSLETGLYSDYYGISQVDLEKNLSLLQESGIISIEYTLSLQKLTSISITAEGSPHNVHSFSRAMLKHAPSATIRISENETTSFIIARIPEDEAYNFITMIPPIGEEQGITLKILPISAYISYRNNLYRRLLKNDGTWHDDVSGLLSQVRLRSKHDD